MQKHRKLGDLLRLIVMHMKSLKDIQVKNGVLSTFDLTQVFSVSNDPTATSFTYVFGSMKGSQDRQYTDMLQALAKRGLHSVASTLTKRQDLPAIDLQESIWLLNANSKRNRDSNYGYSDYQRFKDKQFVFGTAQSFRIDWDIVGTLASDMAIKQNEETVTGVTDEKSTNSRNDVEPVSVLDDATILATADIRLKQITIKQGNPILRKVLLTAYKAQCAVTGANVLDVLDAVCLTQNPDVGPTMASHGILMRTDIHSMFQEFMLSIDPSSYEVVLAPRISDSAYGYLEGVRIALPDDQKDYPDQDALKEHFNKFMKRTNS